MGPAGMAPPSGGCSSSLLTLRGLAMAALGHVWRARYLIYSLVRGDKRARDEETQKREAKKHIDSPGLTADIPGFKRRWRS